MEKNEVIEKGEKKKDILLPKNDIVFQTLFSRGKESITKALLEDILKIKIHKLDLDKSKDLLNDNKEDKNGKLDLRAVINEDIECDIEIQLATHKKILERFLYYWAKMYVANLKIGERYENLRKTISIIIVDENIEQLREIEKACTKWRITEEKYQNKILTDYFQLVIIELPKAIKEYEVNKKDEMLQWMMFLDNPEDVEVAKIMKENKDIKEAKEELDKISQDDLVRRRILRAELERMDMEQIKEDAFEDGEKKKAIEIARRMIQEKMPIDIIVKITQLSEKEVKELMKKL